MGRDSASRLYQTVQNACGGKSYLSRLKRSETPYCTRSVDNSMLIFSAPMPFFTNRALGSVPQLP